MSEPSHGLVPVRRALLSVSDKGGLVEFARALATMGVELVSTGGSARALTDAGIAVRSVEDLTGFPEMMDGRVKTLHPRVHGGILAVRTDPAHTRSMREHGIEPIDLVCVNLYPFEATVARPGVSREEAIENIDIGGPSLIRGAAKNHAFVCVVTDPAQYARVVDELRAHAGATTPALREALAGEAFARTASYDGAIAAHLAGPAADGDEAPSVLALAWPRVRTLRYGENPHQHAAVYRDPAWRGPSIASAEPLHGKELSYNNLNDASAALSLAMDLARGRPGWTGAAVVKHANPCGASVAPGAREAVALAMAGDPVAAYGGIVAVCTPGGAALEETDVAALTEKGVFLEVIVAPGYAPGALARLKEKSANVRLLAVGAPANAPDRSPWSVRTILGGALAQSADDAPVQPGQWQHRAGPAPDEERRRDAGALWTMVRALSSNAVAIGGRDGGGDAPPRGRGAPPGGRGVRLFGAGAGQMDRVTSCRLATEKAGALARGAIGVSDAFFPFSDGPEILIRAGVTTIVHTGGSKRDQDTFDLCDRHGVTVLTTGVRHFRH